MVNLNEDIFQEFYGAEEQNQTSYENSFVSVNGSKQKPNADGIVIPPSVEEIKQTKALNKVAEKNDKETKKRNIRKRKEQKPDPEKIPEKNYKEANDIVRQEIEETENVDIPKDVDIVQTEYDLNNALEDIPNGDDVELGDLTFTKVDKKSKAGYFKCKVSWKREDIPEQLKKIASYVKTQTKGMISPRIVDLIRIGNTNRTQLKNSKLKLSAITIVFKPKSDRLKVNKFNRFMISVPEDYKSTKNLIIYMQESRKHTCIELTSKDFKTEEHFNQFLGDRIAEYFFVGYDVALNKIELRNVDNPIMEIVDLVVKTNDYKAKPYTKDNKIYKVDFKSNGTKNEWLYVTLETSNKVMGCYRIQAKSIADDDFLFTICDKNKNNDFTLEFIRTHILEALSRLYNMDWKIENEKRDTYLYYQLSKPMQKAMDYIDEKVDTYGDNPMQIKLDKIRTKKEWKQIIDREKLPFYYAESTYYTTKDCEFVLSYIMLKQIGGDKRQGKSYITTDDYYSKTGVKTRDPYQKRRNTILSKTGETRNYNNGINLYQVDYTVKGKKHKYSAKTLDELFKETGLLTNNIKFPKSKF